MVNFMVEKATSDQLIGPDWAMNIEICDTCNQNPVNAKDVIKGIKKRIGSRNPKVQILALTLLETVVKNCGDMVHMHVAERGVLHDMVKIVKKKPDFHVREKILTLLDTWQEAFSRQQARYPQYYVAYQELLRAGAVFPPRSDRAVPVFTPSQAYPTSPYPRGSQEFQEGISETTESEIPTMSLSEIQNARAVMDILVDMLNALDPTKKEELNQEVIVDLVNQCRSYKQRVVHLVNSTSDESLLSQGLAFNDDLQRVLVKHDAIASGAISKLEKPDPRNGPLVDVEAPLVDTGVTSKKNEGSTSSARTLDQLLLPMPEQEKSTAIVPINPKIDLLSGDDYSSPKSESSLALVPVGPPENSAPPSHESALVLYDMLAGDSNTQNGNKGSLNPLILSDKFHQQPTAPSPEATAYSNASNSHHGQPLYVQDGANGAISQPQYTVANGLETSSSEDLSLPPPPWESQASEAASAGVQDEYSPATTLHSLPHAHSQPVSQNLSPYYPTQFNPHLPQQPLNTGPLPQGYQGAQMAMYPHHIYGIQAPAYGYGEQYTSQYLSQHVHGLSVQEKTGKRREASHVPAPAIVRPSKPEDMLFSDLVDIAKVKPA